MKRVTELATTVPLTKLIPAPNPSLELEQSLSEWGNLPYACLSVLLANVRYLSMLHKTHHWVARGDSFYGDHLLFDRLYTDTVEEEDKLAEKVVGMGGVGNVDLALQVRQLAELVSSTDGRSQTIPQPSELAKTSLLAERAFLEKLAECERVMKEAGEYTSGVENLIQGIADKHEEHVFLLKQRCGGAQ